MQVYGEESYEAEKEKRLEKGRHSLPTWACWVLFLVGSVGLSLTNELVSLILKNTSLYFTSAYVVSCNPTYTTDQVTYLVWLNFISYLIIAPLLVTLLWAFDKQGFKQKFKTFANGQIWLYGFLSVLILLAASYALGVLSSLVEKASGLSSYTNSNQELVTQMFKDNPVVLIVEVALLAPLTEEITYRQGLFEAIRRKNRFWAYVAVCVVFGAIHVAEGIFSDLMIINQMQAKGNTEAVTVCQDMIKVEFLALPDYMLAGGLFAFFYEKHDSLPVSIIAHSFNNIVSIVQISFLIQYQQAASSSSAASGSIVVSFIQHLILRV
jgi:membrane protease YdiL (CAAX protease family)